MRKIWSPLLFHSSLGTLLVASLGTQVLRARLCGAPISGTLNGARSSLRYPCAGLSYLDKPDDHSCFNLEGLDIQEDKKGRLKIVMTYAPA